MADSLELNVDDSALTVEAEPSSVSESDATPVSDTLDWARDVYWASENMGGRLSKKAAGTGRRYALWQYATTNTKDFIGQMLPKAMQIRDRAMAKNSGDGEGDGDEIRDINQLKIFLRNVVRESGGV
jgi:hypothetical protein